MKLPDFLAFEAFNRIRHQMGAEKLGHFEFFDPRLQLTAAERLALEQGVTAGWAQLRSLHDFTLAYKNSRVLLWMADMSPDETPRYHLAWCRLLRHHCKASPEQRLQVATGLPSQASGWEVCGSCLQQLRFQGYDAARNRHRDYSERVRQAFELDAFFAQYPAYPLSTEVLQALDATNASQWVEKSSSDSEK